MLICATTGTAAISQVSFTAVRAQIDNGVTVFESQTSQSFAEVGDTSIIFAKARAIYGNNGAYATATHLPEAIGAYAESIWVDAFNIQGGSGVGSLSINVLVSGSLDGAGQPRGPGSNSYYQLYASQMPIFCDFDQVACTGTAVIPLTEAISGSRLFSTQLPFTYGQTFYIASYLGAEVLGNGFSDFYHSARFGATAPGNALIVGNSGITYTSAASVPEPTTFSLFFVGAAVLFGLGGRSWRTHHQIRDA